MPPYSDALLRRELTMLIPTEDISDWKELQDRVAQLFREMGYDVLSPHDVQLVRGTKEVDVYVRDPRTSIPHVILIECKKWGSNIPKETVHSFQTVMEASGANAGIIVGSKGFQSGAKAAVTMTNIELKTWESLQSEYGNEWFLRQRERLAPLDAKLKEKDRTYLDQWETPKSLTNTMRFERMGRLEDLYSLLNEGRMLVFAMMGGPKSYDQPGPIETGVYDGYPGEIADQHGLPVVRHKDVRAWFRWVENQATSLLAQIETLEAEVFQGFEALHVEESNAAFKDTLRLILEEMPVRLLKPLVGDAEYARLIGLLADRPDSPGAGSLD